MSDTKRNTESATVEWVTLEDAVNHGPINQFYPSLRSIRWAIDKPEVRRHLVESGALIKLGKAWRISLIKAPAILEEIYREQSLAALNRVAPAPVRQRRSAQRGAAIACA